MGGSDGLVSEKKGERSFSSAGRLESSERAILFEGRRKKKKEKTQKKKKRVSRPFPASFSEMAGLEALLFNAQDGYLGKRAEERTSKRKKNALGRMAPGVSFL